MLVLLLASTRDSQVAQACFVGVLALLRYEGLLVQPLLVGHSGPAKAFGAVSNRRAVTLDPWAQQGSQLAATFWRSCGGADVAVVVLNRGLLDEFAGSPATAECLELLAKFQAPALLCCQPHDSAGDRAAAASALATVSTALHLLDCSQGTACAHQQDMAELARSAGGCSIGAVSQRAVQRARQWLADGAPALEQVHDIFASYVSLAPLHGAMQAATPEAHLPPPTTRLPSARGAAAAFELDAARREERRQSWQHAGPSGSGRPRASQGRVVIAVATDAGEPPAELQGNLAVLEELGCEIVPFSLCLDWSLPRDAAGLVICGRPTEHCLAALSGNAAMRHAVAAFATAGGAVYGEGAGLAYLAASAQLVDESFSMTDVLPLRVSLMEGAEEGRATFAVRGDARLLAPGSELRGTVEECLEVRQELAARPLGGGRRRSGGRDRQLGYAWDVTVHTAEDDSCRRPDSARGLRRSLQGRRRSGDGPLSARSDEGGGAVVEGYSAGAVLATAAHVCFASCPEAVVPFVDACRAVDTVAAGGAAALAAQRAMRRRSRHTPASPPLAAATWLNNVLTPCDAEAAARHSDAHSTDEQSARLRLSSSASLLTQHAALPIPFDGGSRHRGGLSWDGHASTRDLVATAALSASPPSGRASRHTDGADASSPRAVRSASLSLCATPPRAFSRASFSSQSALHLRAREHRSAHAPPASVAGSSSGAGGRRRSCVWPPRVNGFVRVTSGRDIEVPDACASSTDACGSMLQPRAIMERAPSHASLLRLQSPEPSLCKPHSALQPIPPQAMGSRTPSTQSLLTATLSGPSPVPVRPLVSLAPSLTDVLYALGAGACVHGVTSHCHTPDAEGAASGEPAPRIVASLLGARAAQQPSAPPHGSAAPAGIARDAARADGERAAPRARGPLRWLRSALRRVRALEAGGPGAWRAAAARVHDRDGGWQPLHEVCVADLQHLDAPLILAWEPEAEAAGAVLPEIEPCHIGTLDSVGNADLDADLVTVPPPRTLAGVCAAMRVVGAVVHREAAAEALVAGVRRDLRAVAAACTGASSGGARPRVLALRGVAPYRLAGGWVPEMVALVGGEPLEAAPGDGGRCVTWQRIAALAPDVILLLVEGTTLEDALAEAGRLVEEPGWWHLPAVVRGAVFAAHAADVLDAGPGVARACGAVARMVRPEVAWEERAGSEGGVLARRLAMKPRQRCRAAFLPEFFEQVVL